LRSLALCAVLLLSACGGNETDRRNDINPSGASPIRAGYSDIFGGTEKFAAVSADEGQAAEVGRSILQGGGNAVDAAVAMYFAMTVTLPSAAGLGASGVCIVHDAKTKAGEAFVFSPVAAPGPIKGVSFTVPTAVRAIALMQIRHGQARWELDIAPSEKLASFGVPVSRALARDLAAGGASLSDEARRVFTRNGVALGQGDNLVQSDLAATLAAIRRGNGVDFFQGNFARRLSEQIAQLGGSLPVEALRNAVPQSGPPPSESDGGYRVYVAPPPMASASALAGWNGQPAPSTAVPTDSGGFSGFAAIDEKGNAAACSLSMGQLFGTHLMVPGTGMMLAAPTPDSTAMSPVVIGNPNNGEVKFAGAGSGSSTASYATGAIARATIDEKLPVRSALARNAGRGGYVNAIACPYGIRSGGATCQTGTDSTAFGAALVATER
jgi:gamma-glutamyltranspeptidase/glutathione hydrolase